MAATPIATRRLGPEAVKVSALGLGCMGMSQSYGPADESESVATIHRALDLGVTFLDTANVYGRGHNERLVGRAIADRREQVVLATKFAIEFEGGARRINGNPDYDGAAATSHSPDSGPITSTSTSSIESTPRCPSRRRSEPWPSW